MMWIILTALSIYILPNVCAKSLRKNADLLSFNTDVNKNMIAKIQDDAVIISLLRVAYTDDDLTKEHILFGFDIFNFIPQNFRVSVNYPKKKILLNLTSTINTYSIEFDLKKSEKIKSLFLRLNDEDDTVFVVVNCVTSSSVVTPLNLIKFFRIAAVNKFKILFNKRYELNVYTEDDDMEGKIQEKCNIKEVIPEGKKQIDLQLDRIATQLVKYTPHLYSFLYSSENTSEVALEIFLKAFLSKDVVHKTSNVYRLVHMIQSLSNTFLEIFQPELQVLLSKIFWTQGKEHHYIRKWRPNYFNDVNVKNELINIMFADAPKTFLDSMRSLTKIGQKFREVFASPRISINKIMRNDSYLKDTLLDIVFQKPLDRDQRNFLNPNHIIKKMFANYYLRDLSINPKILNSIHKHIIFHADQQDYITIGKFFRYVFFKDSGFLHANIFLESDLVIGMRVVYVLATGQIDEKRDIYWTVRSLITKKDVELPKALEYPENIITNTLRKCYMNPEMSRYIFMQTLENLFIYNNPKIGSFLDHNQGAFIYNLYRDLILNDIQKEKSVLKSVLLKASFRVQSMIGLMIQSVVANVDNVKELRQIAVVFVKNTLSYAKIDASHIAKTETDYVNIFKKIVGKASNVTEKQKKINFKLILLKLKFEKKDPGSDSIEKALSEAQLKLDKKVIRHLKEVYKKYYTNADTLVRKIDEILENRYTAEKEFEDIVAQDLKEGVTFDNRPITNETSPLFRAKEGEEDESMAKERLNKLRELNLLEDWYTEQAKFYSTPVRSKSSSSSLNYEESKSSRKSYETSPWLNTKRYGQRITTDNSDSQQQTLETKYREVGVNGEEGRNIDKNSPVDISRVLRTNKIGEGIEPYAPFPRIVTSKTNYKAFIKTKDNSLRSNSAYSQLSVENKSFQKKSSDTTENQLEVTQRKGYTNGKDESDSEVEINKIKLTAGNKDDTKFEAKFPVETTRININENQATEVEENGSGSNKSNFQVGVDKNTLTTENKVGSKIDEAASRMNNVPFIINEAVSQVDTSEISNNRKGVKEKNINGTRNNSVLTVESRANIKKGETAPDKMKNLPITDKISFPIEALVRNNSSGPVTAETRNNPRNNLANSQLSIEKSAIAAENKVSIRNNETATNKYKDLFKTEKKASRIKSSAKSDNKGAVIEERRRGTRKDKANSLLSIEESALIAKNKVDQAVSDKDKSSAKTDKRVFQVRTPKSRNSKGQVTERKANITENNRAGSLVKIENSSLMVENKEARTVSDKDKSRTRIQERVSQESRGSKDPVTEGKRNINGNETAGSKVNIRKNVLIVVKTALSKTDKNRDSAKIDEAASRVKTPRNNGYLKEVITEKENISKTVKADQLKDKKGLSTTDSKATARNVEVTPNDKGDGTKIDESISQVKISGSKDDLGEITKEKMNKTENGVDSQVNISKGLLRAENETVTKFDGRTSDEKAAVIVNNRANKNLESTRNNEGVSQARTSETNAKKGEFNEMNRTVTQKNTTDFPVNVARDALSAESNKTRTSNNKVASDINKDRSINAEKLSRTSEKINNQGSNTSVNIDKDAITANKKVLRNGATISSMESSGTNENKDVLSGEKKEDRKKNVAISRMNVSRSKIFDRNESTKVDKVVAPRVKVSDENTTKLEINAENDKVVKTSKIKNNKVTDVTGMNQSVSRKENPLTRKGVDTREKNNGTGTIGSSSKDRTR